MNIHLPLRRKYKLDDCSLIIARFPHGNKKYFFFVCEILTQLKSTIKISCEQNSEYKIWVLSV